MIPAAVLLFSSFALSLVLTPALRSLFIRRGWVDLPDNVRKLHSRPIPRSGGIAIMLACALSFLAAYVLRPTGSVLYIQHHVLISAVLPATLLVFLTGCADDLLNLRPKYKLLGQTAAALFTVLMGVRLDLPHVPAWVSVIISIVWLLACSNAINLIDGMDGLAGGVSLLAVLTTLAVGITHHNYGLIFATAPLLGSLFGFLRYNFYPASVFLGDAGSLTIGFVLGCLGMVWSGQSGGFNLLGPLIALALPLIDVMLAISRRYLRNVPIFRADRGHIHHRVLALGFSTRGATLVLYACCVVFALLALLQSVARWQMDTLILAFFLLIILVGIRRLDYVEFRAVHGMLKRGELRTALSEEIHLQEISAELSAASTPDECWKAMRRMCERSQVSQLTLQIIGREFHYRTESQYDGPTYSMFVPLGKGSSLVLSGTPRTASRMLNMNIDLLQNVLKSKIALFESNTDLHQKVA